MFYNNGTLFFLSVCFFFWSLVETGSIRPSCLRPYRRRHAVRLPSSLASLSRGLLLIFFLCYFLKASSPLSSLFSSVMSINIEYSSSFVFTGNRGTKAGRAVNKLKIRTKKRGKTHKTTIELQ